MTKCNIFFDILLLFRNYFTKELSHIVVKIQDNNKKISQLSVILQFVLLKFTILKNG